MSDEGKGGGERRGRGEGERASEIRLEIQMLFDLVCLVALSRYFLFTWEDLKQNILHKLST